MISQQSKLPAIQVLMKICGLQKLRQQPPLQSEHSSFHSLKEPGDTNTIRSLFSIVTWLRQHGPNAICWSICRQAYWKLGIIVAQHWRPCQYIFCRKAAWQSELHLHLYLTCNNLFSRCKTEAISGRTFHRNLGVLKMNVVKWYISGNRSILDSIKLVRKSVSSVARYSASFEPVNHVIYVHSFTYALQIVSIVLWKSAGAEAIPKGNLL